MPHIRYLFDKFIEGTCSQEEFDELMQLLQQGAHEKEVRAMLKQVYETTRQTLPSDTWVGDDGQLMPSAVIPESRRSRGVATLKWSAVAAGMALLLGSIAWHFMNSKKIPAPVVKSGQVNQVTTTAGSRTSIVLPDGTKVWLNSCSSLRYEGELLNGNREVTLTGEAFFEVKHDERHPFIIHTRNFDVTDLGTVFNVRAYPEDAMAEAALISGSIEVAVKNGREDKIVLRPHEKITVYNDHEYSRDTVAMGLHVSRGTNTPVSKISRVTPIVTDPEYKMAVDTAWMANKLIFTNEAFADLALQMERRYGVKVYFENEKASRYKFTGRFEDESIDQALEELQAIASFRYKKIKNQVFISK